MSRSRKDGIGGGGHKSLNLKRDDYDNRHLKKQAIRDHRRRSKQIGFEEVEKHFQSEALSPAFEYWVHRDITHALKRVSDPEFLLKSVVNIADMSDVLETNTYVQGIIALVEDKERWIRPLETWRVETYNPDEQFSDLVRHLLADYDVPRFMDNAWIDGNRVHQNWFKHIAGGQNIRTASGLPFVLTKKAAHYFLAAPDDYTIAEALRWGQVYALGGNKNLAEALRGTYLVRALNRDTAPEDFWFVEEDFWISVIRFFIRNPRLRARRIGPIIDYIQHQKYTGQRIVAEGGTMGPPHPNFSMKGRTPDTLIQQVGGWHLELHRTAEAEKEKKMRQCKWKRSRIGAFRFQQGSRTWDITEITNQSELHAEGKIMGHCVLTYLELCRSGETSIWSMTIQDAGETVWKKAVTIAVVPRSRRITEVRGKFNRFPTQEEKSILKRWATAENLKIPSYI